MILKDVNETQLVTTTKPDFCVVTKTNRKYIFLEKQTKTKLIYNFSPKNILWSRRRYNLFISLIFLEFQCGTVLFTSTDDVSQILTTTKHYDHE